MMPRPALSSSARFELKTLESAAVDALDAIAESDSSGFYRLENPAGITFVLGRWIRSRIIRASLHSRVPRAGSDSAGRGGERSSAVARVGE